MTTTNPIDTGFAPWSLMTPDPGVSKRGSTPTIQEARLTHRDADRHPTKPDNGYLFGEEGFSFGDFLDVVNPLHHLPVVGAIYRSLTGDEIDPGAKVAGSALYGGPVGMAAGVVNAMIEDHTGDDLGGHAMALLFGGEEEGAAVASGAPPVEVASLSDADFVNSNAAFASASGLYAANANTGAITAQQMPAARYGGAAEGADGTQDIASALFAANGNSAAAANVAAFNSVAYRRSDLAGASPTETPQVASQPAANSGGPTRISQRMAEHLAKLAGQTESPVLSGTIAAPAQPKPAPQYISGPLPQAFSANAPEGNPFAAATQAPSAFAQTAALPAADMPSVRADRMQDAISQSDSAAVGYENPNDIARAMMTAIERYEQQRASLKG